jgi:hypothetical protein
MRAYFHDGYVWVDWRGGSAQFGAFSIDDVVELAEIICAWRGYDAFLAISASAERGASWHTDLG